MKKLIKYAKIISVYVEGSAISLWDYWDPVNNLETKNIKDVYYQESYYVFPTTIVYEKIWFVEGQTTYVLNLHSTSLICLVWDKNI